MGGSGWILRPTFLPHHQGPLPIGKGFGLSLEGSGTHIESLSVCDLRQVPETSQDLVPTCPFLLGIRALAGIKEKR